MQNKILKMLKKHTKKAVLFTTLALAVSVFSTGIMPYASEPVVPIFTADPEFEAVIEEEETPLAATTTSNTTKKTSTPKVTLSKKLTKTYSKNLGTTTKTSTATSKTSTAIMP